MSETASTAIHCMLIPLRKNLLLLPNTTIAEIVSLPAIEQTEHNPDFYAGTCSWRAHQIPVVDFESLFDNVAADTGKITRLCVLNSINASTNLTFYGIPCHGSPQLITLNESIIQAVDTPPQNYIHSYINIANTTAIIPDLDTIEVFITGENES